MKLKFALLLGSILLLCAKSYAQQWALYNTRTLYDAFENPSQKTFQADSSRRYAFNFFLPTGGATLTGVGPADSTMRGILYGRPLNASGIDMTDKRINRVSASQNTYIFMLRVFKSIQYNRELGISWQVKSDVNTQITNETFTIFHNYQLLNSALYNDILNDKGLGQSYHQFSLSYRENYNRRLAFGAKLSYLSGIAYAKLSIDKSSLTINKEQHSLDAVLKGTYRSNFLYNNFDSELLIPNIKNPGAAVTLSANYKSRRGFFFLGNLKDLGFIYWTNKPTTFHIDQTIDFEDATGNTGSRIRDEIKTNGLKNPTSEKFTSIINGKAELLINKDFGAYQPNLILSKNLFYSGGSIALINTYKGKLLNFSLSTAYDLNKTFQLGGQVLLKSPNLEFFIGSDQLFKTFSTTQGIINSNPTSGKGYTGASAYLGFALKFGPILERRSTSSVIPGFEQEEKSSFFRRIFKIRRVKTH